MFRVTQFVLVLGMRKSRKATKPVMMEAQAKGTSVL